MTDTPKVSPEERDRQIASLHERIGQIVVHAEHLNHRMNFCCVTYLELRGLPQAYGHTVLAGRNIENMRRTWTALMKQEYSENADAIKIIEELSARIDTANKQRNEIIHRIWFIGWGNNQTESFERASGIKVTLDNRKGRKGRKGGVKVSDRDSGDFETVIGELKLLVEMIGRVMGCVVIGTSHPSRGRLENNFHFVDGKLMPGKGPTPE